MTEKSDVALTSAQEKTQREKSRGILVAVIAAILVLAATTLVWSVYMKNNEDENVVSRIVKTPDGKGYLEVDGKPFLFGYVENWGIQQTLGDTG